MSKILFDTKNAVVQEITDPLFEEHRVNVFIKRDDLIHQEVSGNKWRKLKYNVDKCFDEKLEGILTFGGAYSNHLVATAAACKEVGLLSVGIVRGDELNPQSNETLKRCSEYGMKLVFVSREEYVIKDEPAYLKQLHIDYPSFHIVPEGGANYLGMIGCQQMMNEITIDFDEVFVAQGTTTTSCGIALALDEGQILHAVPVLKGFDSIPEMRSLFRGSGIEEEYIDELLESVVVHDNYHFGGYGKYNPELLEFIQSTYRDHGLKLDPVYTGKAFYALIDQISSGKLDGKRVLFIHTGGIQGSRSIEEREGISLY